MAAISPALQTHRSPQKCLLAPLALLALSKTPPLLTQRKLRHRSTRTLNPLALGAAAPSKPNFHHLHHTHHRAQRSVRPSSASPQANGRGGHFRHPGRWWQPCVTPYFADLGVGDMRGARASNIHRHPGGGGRPSAPIARPRSPHLTPYYIMCQNFSIISGVIYATTTCNPPFMFFYRKYLKKNLVVAASLSNFIP